MTKLNFISVLAHFILLVLYGDTYSQIHHDLESLLRDIKSIDSQLKLHPCGEDYVLQHKNTFQDYSFWSNEMRTTNNVANYLTSMWRFKDKNNHSLIENEVAIYNLAKTMAMSSDNIYGSVVCFDENKFQQRKQFCPYAFKDSARKNPTMKIHDLGRLNDYLTTPSQVSTANVSKPNKTFTKYNFNWWHLGKTYFFNVTQLKQNTVYFDTNFDKLATNSSNVFETRTYYNITSNYIPSSYGRWTTPYYDCFGGKAWMITYLAPFYDETDTFLGCVTFDIELNSIEIDQCDAPQTIKTGKNTLDFYGTHACRNKTTECVHVHGGGFTAKNYHCVCRKGFYFPNPNAKNKYFDGSDVFAAKGKANYSLYDCLPCREGCQECVDDTPCMYQRKMSLRAVLLSINEIIKAVAIILGVFVFVFRKNKIIKASSPVFMEIIVFGVVLMYFEITLGYFEDSVPLCIARSWFYHTGFILAFGSVFLKTWRIAVIFHFQKNRKVKKRDKTLLQYLSIMFIAVVCYLMIWTWTQTHEYEIEKTSGGFKYGRCVRKWFSMAIEIGEVLLLLSGVWLCLRVRKTPSAYNESKYIAWCIYNTVFTKILVGLLRFVLDNFRNPDMSYVMDFLSTHVVATILLALLFISKIYRMRKYLKQKQKDSHGSSATSTGLPVLYQSPFNPAVQNRQTEIATTEIFQLREEIRNLNAKLILLENKRAGESKRLDNRPVTFNFQSSDFQNVFGEDHQDKNSFSVAAESIATNKEACPHKKKEAKE